MGQRSFADFTRKVRLLAGPITECTAHAVNRCLIAEALKKLTHRTFTQIFAPFARKYESIPLVKLHFVQDGEDSVAQRNAMLAAAFLHAFGWNDPHPGGEIEFGPPCA